MLVMPKGKGQLAQIVVVGDSVSVGKLVLWSSILVTCVRILHRNSYTIVRRSVPREFIVLLYVTFSDSGRSCYSVPVDMTTVKGNLRNSGRIPAENAP